MITPVGFACVFCDVKGSRVAAGRASSVGSLWRCSLCRCRGWISGGRRCPLIDLLRICGLSFFRVSRCGDNSAWCLFASRHEERCLRWCRRGTRCHPSESSCYLIHAWGVYRGGVFEVLVVVPGADGRFGRPASTRARACLPRGAEFTLPLDLSGGASGTTF